MHVYTDWNWLSDTSVSILPVEWNASVLQERDNNVAIHGITSENSSNKMIVLGENANL